VHENVGFKLQLGGIIFWNATKGRLYEFCIPGAEYPSRNREGHGLGLAPCLIIFNFSIFEYGGAAEGGGGGRLGPPRARSLWPALRLTIARRATRLIRRFSYSCYRRRIGRGLPSAQLRAKPAPHARRSFRAYGLHRMPLVQKVRMAASAFLTAPTEI